MDQYTIIGSDNKPYGPFSPEEITQWVREGRINARTSSQKNDEAFQPLGDRPEFVHLFGGRPREQAHNPLGRISEASPGFSAKVESTSPDAVTAAVISIITPLAQATGWIKLIAVVMFIAGAFHAISIVGLIIAWLPIWLGVLLWKTATLVTEAKTSGDLAQATAATQTLKRYFIINGVMMLMIPIVMIFFFIIGFLGALGEMSGY